MNFMTSVGVIASIAVLGAVAFLGVAGAKTAWQRVVGRGRNYQIVS